jgi:hypothetical protein
MSADRPEGPPAQALADRLARCPEDFLAEPRMGDAGMVDTAAVVSDLLVELGGEAVPSGKSAGRFRPRNPVPGDRNRLQAVLVACWLLHDEAFRATAGLAPAAAGLLDADVAGLAELVPARAFVADPDRRQELARRALDALGLRPAGESEPQAADRLQSLDSVQRARVLADTRAAAQRAEEIRQAMLAAAAAEAAARAMPE